MKFQSIEILEWDIFKGLPIQTGVTTRNGGFSNKPYESFNLATHTGDNKTVVNSNRKILTSALKSDIKHYTHGIQIHSDFIHKVCDLNMGMNNIECDGLFTTSPIPLINIFVADCVPIIVYDKEKNIGGLCHCGWKGTQLKLVQKMISTFTNKYNSEEKDILIGIGPSIGACCYNVSKEIYDSFKVNGSEGSQRENKYYLDLKEINKNQAIKMGINKLNIETMNLCTSCNNDLFYSHRKEGEPSGRFSCYLKLTS